MSTITRAAAVAARYTADVVTRPRPRTPDDVPAFPSAITPQWMTLVLDRPGVTVTAARYEHMSSGTASRGRLHLEYDGPAAALADLPATIFVKSTPSFLTRLQVGVTGGAEAEIRFYMRIRPDLDVLAPRGYFGKAERSSGRSVLLIDDLDGSIIGDPRTVPIDRRRAEQIVDTLAGVHAAFRDSPRFSEDLRWIRTSWQVQEALNRSVDFARRVQVGVDRGAAILPAPLTARRGELHELVMRSLRLDERQTRCLVHADVHSANWFFDNRGAGLFDWTSISAGIGTRDLAYALSSGLASENRAAWERELVDRYARRVATISGTAVDPEATWISYRQQMMLGLYLWLYTLGRGHMQPRMQPDEISRINVERIGRAVDELGTLDAVASV